MKKRERGKKRGEMWENRDDKRDERVERVEK